jgi:catechol 2,3-dioxygenase-like lactoylglutathione lyase family enzyme
MQNPRAIHALVRVGLNSPDAPRLLQFYERAFGAQRQPGTHLSPAAPLPPGARTVLSLGDATLEVCQFDVPGRPYPSNLPPDDPRFQHLCIVVSDMRAAMERLSQTRGWSSISTDGPENLPVSNGGVTAFKFRDPDGHPLELLQFAADKIPAHWRNLGRHDIHLGIDHSAISVIDAGRSIRFYENLGLHRTSQTLNQGAAQQRLDGVTAPVVDVVALTPPQPTPHVELLHYHAAVRPTHAAPAVNDIAATRLVFAAASAPSDPEDCLIQDPDGHFLQFE